MFSPFSSQRRTACTDLRDGFVITRVMALVIASFKVVRYYRQALGLSTHSNKNKGDSGCHKKEKFEERWGDDLVDKHKDQAAVSSAFGFSESTAGTAARLFS